MHFPYQGRRSDVFLAIALAISAVTALFYWQGSYGFSLWDEGFLWYGAQRTDLGEVPIRDFMAYDPGRYYWSSWLMRLQGSNGIMALRRSVAVFQALGLAIGLLLISVSLPPTLPSARSGTPSNRGRATALNAVLLAIATLVLSLWMFPRHKLFDVSVSIMLVGILTWLIQRPTYYRHFFTGIVVGLVAVFGRNHGVYGLVGSLGVTVYLSLTRKSWVHFSKALLSGAVGVMNGYLPVLIMLATISGFAPAFVESIRFLFEIKSTNLPLPVPWPWLVPTETLSAITALNRVLMGFFFVAVALYAVAGLLWVATTGLRQNAVPPVAIASAFMALPYAHYAFSRADFSHLAQGIFPFLLGCLSMLANRRGKLKWACAGLLVVSSLLVTLPHHPGWQCRLSTNQCAERAVSGDRLQIHVATASDIVLLKDLVEEFAPGDRPFIATPFWPGAYALLERQSPMWAIYALFPRSEAFQQLEIERIKAAEPELAVVLDIPLDGRDELRFSQTNPLIDAYIKANFELLGDRSPNSDYQILRRK